MDRKKKGGNIEVLHHLLAKNHNHRKMSLHEALLRLENRPLYIQLYTIAVPPKPVVYEYKFQHVHSTVWDLHMKRKEDTSFAAIPTAIPTATASASTSASATSSKNRFRLLEVTDQKVAHGALLGIATHHAGVLETPLSLVWVHKPSLGCWHIEGPAAEMKAIFTPNNSETMPGWKSLIATRFRVIINSNNASLVLQSFWPQALGGGLIQETQVAQPPEDASPWESIV